jgi:TATA-box binding protein (TBP) (component of TFIID and TFIIIB)
MKISTIVVIVDLKTTIDINAIFKYYPLNKYIIDIKPTRFSNQITMIVHLDKKINVKIFNNGKIQITGLTENYIDQTNKIIDLLYKYGKDINFKSVQKCTVNKDNIITTIQGGNIIGKTKGSLDYSVIGYIKGKEYFINNNKLVPFKITTESKIIPFLISSKHINKVKKVYSTFGLYVGDAEFIVLGNIMYGRDITPTIKERVFYLHENIDYSKPLLPDSKYHTFRTTKNLILKNRIIRKYSDTVYIIYYSDKKQIKNDDLYDSTNVYGYIKIKWNDQYTLDTILDTIDTIDTVDTVCKVFESCEFSKNENREIQIANINADLNLPHLNSDILNLSSFNKLITTFDIPGLTIDYRPTEYPATIIKFADLNTSIRVFKTFNCILTGKDPKVLQDFEKHLVHFVEDNYSNLIYNKAITQLNVPLKELSILDLI